MPLFKRGVNGGGSPGPKKVAPPVVEPPAMETAKQRLVFHCQQAQGSPTGLISGFSNVKELYAKIAECYEFPASEMITNVKIMRKREDNEFMGQEMGHYYTTDCTIAAEPWAADSRTETYTLL